MQLSVQTAHHARIDYELAGIGYRILAFMIDVLIQGALGILISFIALPFFALMSRGGTGNTFLLIILFVFIPLYHLLCELFMGRSVGKVALGLRIVRLDGKKISFWDTLLRWVFRIVDITICSGVVAMIAIIVSRNARRIGDIAAGTTVVREKSQTTLSDLTRYAAPEAYAVVFPQANLLSDQDIAIVKEVVSEVRQRMEYKLLEPLARKIKSITGIVTDMDNLTFVTTILKDHHHLTKE
ncbi:MAG: RDD family protein [Culturomica sp.]|jgi:uncharacterized RDD family membrane protein YckC|nr:RDD family protein [Culturomica sp.]